MSSFEERWLDRIHNQECVAGMKEMPENCIDLTVTSPPYGGQNDGQRTYNGFIYDFKSIANELWRITKPGGVVFWNVYDKTINGTKTGDSLRQATFFQDCGFNLDYVFYEKAGFRFPDDDRYYSVIEFCWLLSKGKPKTIQLITDRKVKYERSKGLDTKRDSSGTLVMRENYTDSKEYGVRYNIWRYNTVTEQKWEEASWHPAVMPMGLALDAIVSWSKRGDVVLDPHSGSGTTAKACRMLGRRYIGFEISTEYYLQSLPNIEKYQFQEKLEMERLNWNIYDQEEKAKEESKVDDITTWLS